MKKKIRRAFESATPDLMDQVLLGCLAQAEGAAPAVQPRPQRFAWHQNALSTAAAVLLFLGVCGVAVWMISSNSHFAVVDPTETTTQTEPSETEPTPMPPILGFGGINHNEEIPTNPEGIPVIEYGYHNYYSNGFILDSAGEAFLSLHGGELQWVDATASDIQLTHEGKDYRLRFVWCSYAGEVGIKGSGASLAPISGSDRYVSLRIEKYPYLLDLQTMTVSDPVGGLDLDPTTVSVSYAPDAKSCFVIVDGVHYFVDISSREMTPLTELTGLENVSYVYYVNQNILALVDVFEDEYPQEWRANGYLYNIQDGTRKDLYTNAWFGWLSDSGGVEHYGDMYLNFRNQKLQITDCISGKQTLTDIAYIPYLIHCGADQVLVTAKASYQARESVECLISADGTVTPLFVIDADILVENVLGESALQDHPPYEELLTFIYKGEDPFYWVKPDVSGCAEGHLYYYHEKSGRIAPIVDEPVVCCNDDSNNLYFVKEAEPNKLYCAPLTNLEKQTVLYESDFGSINFIYVEPIGAYEQTLMLTEGNKRGVLLDLLTGDAEIYIEQYYIEIATIEDMKVVDGKRSYNRIWFKGKLNEEDTLKDYLYYIDTGKVIESYYQ